MPRRTLFSVLLLLVALPLLGSSATIRAQSFTSITNLVTLTTQFTSTSQAFYTFETSYATSTEKAMLYTGPFTLTSPGSNYGCNYQYLPFTATKGQVVSGQLTSSIAISFYVMSEDSFKKWQNQRLCDVKVDTLVKKEGILSYSLSRVIDFDGKYEFLFLNFSSNSDVQVEFDVGIEGGSVTTIAQPIYSTTTQAMVFAVTQTLSSVRTEEVPSFLSGSNNMLLLGIITIVIIVGGFVAFRSLSKRGKPTIPKQQRAGAFCINCAAPLPQGAKFCNKCGATQP